MIEKNRMLDAILFSLLFVIFALAIITNASSLEISEDLVIVGNGTIDRDFGAKSSPHFDGQLLSEYVRPISLNSSAASYRSNFELILSNNSTIFYEASSTLENVKHSVINENFELGVCTGFYFIGTQNKSFLFESSPSLSEALVTSEVEGRSVLRARVVNETEYHLRYVNALTWLQGNYSLDWAFLVIDPDYPEAGEDDWLPCP